VVHEDAGEAVIYRESVRDSPADTSRRCDVPESVRAALDADNRERAARRLRTGARRYAVANRCDRVVTLTYRATGAPVCRCGADRPDYACRECRVRVRADVKRFLRRLRTVYGPVPVGYGLESHADGSVHVHAVMPKRYAPNERQGRVLRELWSRGFVDADPPKRRPIGDGGRERCRSAARYAVKYAD
jgi:hypothetical protein